MNPLVKSVLENPGRGITVRVEQIAVTKKHVFHLVKAMVRRTPGVIHVRRFSSESDALASAANAAFGKPF
jgi:hypothetical protein